MPGTFLHSWLQRKARHNIVVSENNPSLTNTLNRTSKYYFLIKNTYLPNMGSIPHVQKLTQAFLDIAVVIIVMTYMCTVFSENSPNSIGKSQRNIISERCDRTFYKLSHVLIVLSRVLKELLLIRSFVYQHKIYTASYHNAKCSKFLFNAYN